MDNVAGGVPGDEGAEGEVSVALDVALGAARGGVRMTLTQNQVLLALATEPGSGYPPIHEDALRDLDEAMKLLRVGHREYHGHMGEHDNCQVKDVLRHYFGEGND